MSSTLDEDLIYEILSVVDEIPEGCVATYGPVSYTHLLYEKSCGDLHGYEDGTGIYQG